MSSFAETKNIPQGRPLPLKFWPQVTYPLLKAANFPTSHPPRFYAAPNFLKMGIKMPRFVVFWTTSTIKDEKSAAVSLYINCQRQSCSAFDCLSSGINILAGGRPLPPEVLPPSDLPSCQWYLITMFESDFRKKTFQCVTTFIGSIRGQQQQVLLPVVVCGRNVTFLFDYVVYWFVIFTLLHNFP